VIKDQGYVTHARTRDAGTRARTYKNTHHAHAHAACPGPVKQWWGGKTSSQERDSSRGLCHPPIPRNEGIISRTVLKTI